MRRNVRPVTIAAQRISVPHRSEEPDVYVEEIGDRANQDDLPKPLVERIRETEILSLPPSKKYHMMMPTPARWGTFRIPVHCANIDFNAPNTGSETGPLTSLLHARSFDEYRNWVKLLTKVSTNIAAVKRDYYEDDENGNDYVENERTKLVQPASVDDVVTEIPRHPIETHTAATPEVTSKEVVDAIEDNDGYDDEEYDEYYDEYV